MTWTPRKSAVYPRVGGGNLALGGCNGKANGLSPRGRGKLPPLGLDHPQDGSIPAWAGETHPPRAGRPQTRVYPRVGGGNPGGSTFFQPIRGLSPRGRGKRWAGAEYQQRQWSIPAWAGETPRGTPLPNTYTVYPRVGGGNDNPDYIPGPRGGLSPRGRGKLPQQVVGQFGRGSIPAWAGETARRPSAPVALRVYPRVGGGNGLPASRAIAVDGLSPRGRGKLGRDCPDCGAPRSIPAWAGETSGAGQSLVGTGVYPRVGGGNLSKLSKLSPGGGLSPRGRGKP